MEESKELRVKEEELEETDDWVERALLDDRLVAEMLMVFSLPAKDLILDVPRQVLQWGRRLPRSRQINLDGIRKAKEGVEEEDASPLSSPLSWSGGSGGSSSDDPKNPSKKSDKGRTEINASESKQLTITCTGGRAKEVYMESQPPNASSSSLRMLFPHHLSSKSAAASPERVMVGVPVSTLCPSHAQVPRSSWSNAADAASIERVMVGVPSTCSRAPTSSSFRGAPSSSSLRFVFNVPDLNEEPKPEQ